MKTDGYVITIAPKDPSKATAVIEADYDGAALRLKKYSIEAAEDQSLATARVPAVDAVMLIAALTPALTPAPVSPAPPALPSPVTATAPIAEPVAVAAAAAEPEPTATADVAVTRPRAHAGITAPKPARTTTKARPAKTPAPKAAGKKAVATAAPQRRRRGGSTGTAPVTAGGRHPMPDSFVEIYKQAPTVRVIAEHFGVKDYTAQSWVKTARSRGLIPPAHSRKRG